MQELCRPIIAARLNSQSNDPMPKSALPELTGHVPVSPNGHVDKRSARSTGRPAVVWPDGQESEKRDTARFDRIQQILRDDIHISAYKLYRDIPLLVILLGSL